MKINILNIENGLHELQLSEISHDAALLDHGHLTGDIIADISVDKRDTDLNLKVVLSSNALLICDRCLTEFKISLKAKFDQYFRSKISKSGDVDVRRLNPNKPMIDLSQDIQSAFVVALPIKILCIEDCKGLCPSCGADWNKSNCECDNSMVDSRWDKLKELQLSESEEIN